MYIALWIKFFDSWSFWIVFSSYFINKLIKIKYHPQLIIVFDHFYTFSSHLIAIKLHLFGISLIILIDGSPFFIYVCNGKDEELNENSSLYTIMKFICISILTYLLNINLSSSIPALNDLRDLHWLSSRHNSYTQPFILWLLNT